MSTTTGRTIGSGGAFASLALWQAAAPGDLTTSIAGGEIWEGRMLPGFNPSSSGTILAITGTTTDATGYYHLTTDTGASFVDNAGVQSNALRANASNGVMITAGDNYTVGISVACAYTRFSKLQILGTGFAGVISMTSGPVFFSQCISEGRFSSTNVVSMESCLVVRRRSDYNHIINVEYQTLLYNCTLVSPSDLTPAANGIATPYAIGTSIIKNCAVFGATNALSSSGSVTSTTNYCDDASPPSGFTTLTYNTSAFQNITDGTHDYRLKAGSGLLDVGTTETTHAANDIVGTARPEGSAYDVGAWELVVAGGGGGGGTGHAQFLGLLGVA